ncbi:MAG: pyrimidine 5'-nucleotidase [Rhodobacteraceae bacterium]|nr:pyrimidine 5'-nucleotidase [Paracoccaceae bacterium]
MSARDFSHVQTWVFDLDNTLYPPEAALFDQIEVRMTQWVMDALNIGKAEADQLRVDYWKQYGTTLAGLMDVHGVDPTPYLEDVHQISLDHLEHDAKLYQGIRDLPGRKIIYTNGTAEYAGRVTAALGLETLFDAIYGVEDANFRPKPEAQAFASVFGKDGFETETAAMFEDEPRNLIVPHRLGMRTVHVSEQPHPDDPDHIHYHTDRIGDFICALIE